MTSATSGALSILALALSTSNRVRRNRTSSNRSGHFLTYFPDNLIRYISNVFVKFLPQIGFVFDQFLKVYYDGSIAV